MNSSNLKQNLPPVTILHTADFHFPGRRNETDPYWSVPQESPFKALEVLVDTANRLEVDLLLFAGDLFDTYRPSKEVVSFVLNQFKRLRAPAVLIPGNHDCLGPTEPYNLPVWKESGNRLYLITHVQGAVFKPPDLPVLVWGRALEEYSPKFQPLENIPSRDGDSWHLALGHGLFCDEGESYGQSYPIFARQIRESGWDYIALGHQHGFQDVSRGLVKAAYCGSPVAIWNPEPAALLVTFDSLRDDPVTIRKLPLFTE